MLDILPSEGFPKGLFRSLRLMTPRRLRGKLSPGSLHATSWHKVIASHKQTRPVAAMSVH